MIVEKNLAEIDKALEHFTEELQKANRNNENEKYQQARMACLALSFMRVRLLQNGQ